MSRLDLITWMGKDPPVITRLTQGREAALVGAVPIARQLSNTRPSVSPLPSNKPGEAVCLNTADHRR